MIKYIKCNASGKILLLVICRIYKTAEEFVVHGLASCFPQVGLPDDNFGFSLQAKGWLNLLFIPDNNQ